MLSRQKEASMQHCLKSFIPLERSSIGVHLFGYATKGLPGLEIVGLGKMGRNIKEKLIYLTRQDKLVIPKKRFVLCLEFSDETKNLKEEDLRWLELPLLILYWTLAEILPIHHLEKCFSVGKIALDGKVSTSGFSQKLLIDDPIIASLLIIVKDQQQVPAELSCIQLQELLEGKLEFR
jgi:hypothetical protein